MPSLLQAYWRLSYEKLVARHLRRPNIEPSEGQVKAAIRMTEVLRANEIVSIAIDVTVAPTDRDRAIPVEFLGRRILLLPGSVSIAEYTGSPVMVLVVHRTEDWRHQVLEISPPVSQDGNPVTAFKHCVSMLEASIRQNPAFWDYWANSQNLLELGMPVPQD